MIAEMADLGIPVNDELAQMVEAVRGADEILSTVETAMLRGDALRVRERLEELADHLLAHGIVGRKTTKRERARAHRMRQ
jgi:hypothetical protein